MKANTHSIKAIIILVITIAFSQVLQASSNKVITRNYALKEFNTVKIGSAFQVEFIHSNENKVSIEIDEDAVKNLSVSNDENELIIKLKNCNNCKTHTLKAKIYGNSLSGIYVSGASSFTSDFTFDEKNITIKTSGASKVTVSFKTENLNVDISGASRLIAKGIATKQTIDVSGASNYNGKNCKSKDVNITASGASRALIDCTDSIDAEASGASTVRYIKLPKNIKKESSGASSIGLN